MAFLRNKASGAVTDQVNPDSVAYQTLAGLRDAATHQTLWEDVPEEDLAGVASRVIILSNPGAALAADATQGGVRPGRGGTITKAEVVSSAAITGVDTNTRTITAQQVQVSGTSSPTRAVTVLATLALVGGVNTAAGVAKAMTVNQASFSADGDLEVVSTHGGTGLVDPGGLVLLTYTPV